MADDFFLFSLVCIVVGSITIAAVVGWIYASARKIDEDREPLP